MASWARRRTQNVAGEFYVDDTCIDCDTCRWMAPETFHRDDGMSAVHAQPSGPAERRRALHALLSCPTASIGTREPAVDLADTQADFPLPVAEDVWHCGYHAPSSFGAASYLVRTSAGNVLVDSPRFAAPLVRRLEAMGGVHLMVLTHQDDVADHAKFAAHFGCPRLIHAADAHAVPGAERVVDGHDPVEVAPGLVAIPVPGHTRGHMVFLWDQRVLFGGDHVAWSPGKGHLIAFRGANWYSWPETIHSMARLQEHRFEHVLPGHGRPVRLDPAAMQESLQACIAWMRQVA